MFSFHHRPQRRRSSCPPQRKRLVNGFNAAWWGWRYLSPGVGTSSSSAGCSCLLRLERYFSPVSGAALRLPQPGRARSPPPLTSPTAAARPAPCCYGSAGGDSQSESGKDIFVAVATGAAERPTNGDEAGRRRAAGRAAGRARGPSPSEAAADPRAPAGAGQPGPGQRLPQGVLGLSQGPIAEGNKRITRPKHRCS